MGMKPFYQFAKAEEDRGKALAVQLHNGETAVLVDYYCLNPTCVCRDVLIELCKFTADGKKIDRIAAFYLNTENWEIDPYGHDANDANGEMYIDEFAESLDEKWKSMFKNRIKEAKEYGRNNGEVSTELNYHAKSTTAAKSMKVGRNEPCPCGSGKKFKRCCGA